MVTLLRFNSSIESTILEKNIFPTKNSDLDDEKGKEMKYFCYGTSQASQASLGVLLGDLGPRAARDDSENRNTASSHVIYAPTETVIPMIILTSQPDPVFYTTALPPHSAFRAETPGD